MYKKHLCLSLIFNKVTGWKILQISEENVCAGVSFSIKMQAEKILKTLKEALVLESFFLMLQTEKTRNIRKKTLVPESRFYKNCRLEAQYQHQIDDMLSIFITPLLTKS